jgi:hypothetical protein
MKDIIGFVLYRGPSLLTGEPIVAILTLESKNSKTGNMAQIWVIRTDMHPVDAIRRRKDEAICGSCSLRGGPATADLPYKKRRCYVEVDKAPAAVYRSLKRRRYPRFNAAKHAGLLRGRLVRIGAYGDPGAVPVESIMPVVEAHAEGWTGYTNTWGTRVGKAWQGLLMASCHSVAEAQKAERRGWKYFRVNLGDAPKVQGEVMCLSSDEYVAKGGTKRTCLECKLCDGSRASVVIDGHGKAFPRMELQMVGGAV